MSTCAALLLLVAGLAWNNAWKWAPPAVAGDVWSASCGAFITLLLACVGWRSAAPVRLVCVLLAGFALQVFACNVWFVVAPWPFNPGDETCSSLLHFPLGLAGLWAASMVAQWVYIKGRRDA